MIAESIKKLAERANLTKEEAYAAMNDIMSGRATDGQIAGFLMGLRLKGESVEEIAGCALSMREKAVRVTTKHRDVIDTCGTGGDGVGSFNISTTAAIVASAAGVPVAKHGNRAVSSACGSADVLKALGVNIEIPVEKVGKVLDEVGISFLFAPMMHGAMKYAANVRKQLGIRTIFNILGPLTNPAGAKKQVLGVFHSSLTGTMAAVLKELGSEHALIVHGEGGFDELSTLGKTKVSELRGEDIANYEVSIESFGLRKATKDDLKGGNAEENASIVRNILNGSDGAPKEIALYNAGAAIYVGGKADDLKSGIYVAREVVRSGHAAKKLNEWIEATNS